MLVGKLLLGMPDGRVSAFDPVQPLPPLSTVKDQLVRRTTWSHTASATYLLTVRKRSPSVNVLIRSSWDCFILLKGL